MRKLIAITLALFVCSISTTFAQTGKNKLLDSLLNAFAMDYLKLSPVTATMLGFNFYNDQLPVTFTDSYRLKNIDFSTRYLNALTQIKKQQLNENDRLSYECFQWQLKSTIESESFKSNLIPFSQFDGLPLTLAQYGSGKVAQPFATVQDYTNWIKRATAFSAWADSAIVYFKKGIAEDVVLPKVLVEKMIPQMNSFVTSDANKSVFYGPVNNFPKSFSDSDKVQLTKAYVQLINEQIVPSYKKLKNFLQNEYLPKTRTSSGLSAIPGGKALYEYNVKQITTTNITPDELFNTGLAEVKRIRGEMEKIRIESGFKGDLNAFSLYLKTDPKFYPYKTPEEVIAAYTAIQNKISPLLSTMFLHAPKTQFEVRQTEAFRAASSAAQYFPGLADGSRAGIFYVPIVDATKTSIARESLFAHEAIPGHHYQIMLQYENTQLPLFRRYNTYTSYVEGWGLYSESIGKELGLYQDTYQKMANLALEIHRAIRLVVDPGMHVKGWTREQAIKYMMDNEPIDEQGTIAEIERYMAIPGQAVAYKVGSMKLLALRAKYTKMLGKKFDIAQFHDAILKDGALPLDILEAKMDEWANSQK